MPRVIWSGHWRRAVCAEGLGREDGLWSGWTPLSPANLFCPPPPGLGLLGGPERRQQSEGRGMGQPIKLGKFLRITPWVPVGTHGLVPRRVPQTFWGAMPVTGNSLPQPGAGVGSRSEGGGPGRGFSQGVVQGADGREGVAGAEPAPETSSAPLAVYVGRGGHSVCECGGRPVCFGGLAAAGLWGDLSQRLAGAVWACPGRGSHQQSET